MIRHIKNVSSLAVGLLLPVILVCMLVIGFHPVFSLPYFLACVIIVIVLYFFDNIVFQGNERSLSLRFCSYGFLILSSPIAALLYWVYSDIEGTLYSSNSGGIDIRDGEITEYGWGMIIESIGVSGLVGAVSGFILWKGFFSPSSRRKGVRR